MTINSSSKVCQHELQFAIFIPAAFLQSKNTKAIIVMKKHSFLKLQMRDGILFENFPSLKSQLFLLYYNILKI